ncbi:hypothetical protein FQR65_LT19688 [Abscondita terminalis]|nr:hypothetical protein FQR65_LT19688 [Abscondita terminalis]
MRYLALTTLLLGTTLSTMTMAADNDPLNYNIVNVQADATRQVSNDEMHAVLFIEKTNKQPAELSAQITQLMNQAIAISKKYPQVKVETGSQTTYPVYDNDNQKLKDWRGRAEIQIENGFWKSFENSASRRAQILTQAWNKSSYNLVNININTSNSYPQPIYAARASMAKFEAADAGGQNMAAAFNPSPLSLAIAVSFSFISVASYAEDIQEDTPKALKTITVQAEGNWLEEANAEKVHKHAGARSIVDRKKMDESAVTSIRDALKQVPGVQVQDVMGLPTKHTSWNQRMVYREANNDIDIDDVMLKSSYQFNDQDALAVNLHHYEGRGEMPEGLTTADYAKNPYQSNQFRNYFAGRRSDVSVKYSHKDELNNFEVLGYYVDSFRTSDLESAIEGTANSRISNSPRDYKYFGIEPRYSRAYSLGNMNNEVTVGYRYLQEDSSEFSGRTTPYNTATGIPGERLANTISEGGTKAHALYIDNRFGLGAFTITPGVRFESIKTHNDYSAYQSGKFINTVHPKIKSDEFLPSLALQYNFNDQWNIFANAAVSFGPQQYNQLAKVDAGQAVTTLDGLHPEKSNNYEIGTKYLGNGLNAELTVFYLDFDKELILERPDNIGTGIWTNLGATSHKGIELGLNLRILASYDCIEGLKVL